MRHPPITTPPATDKRDQTGLLTRFVPNRHKHSFIYRWFLRLASVLQMASATASLAIFSSRVYKVYRLVSSINTRRGINNATGAVEGILAAAVLYTILATLVSLSLKGGGRRRWLRWLWVLLDLAFVGAFIAVAVLTRPNGGQAGPRHCYGSNRDVAGENNLTGDITNPGDDTCDLTWGTFALAIASTILHAITAAFHEVKHHFRNNNNKYGHMNETPMEARRSQDYTTTTGARNSYHTDGRSANGYHPNRTPVAAV